VLFPLYEKVQDGELYNTALFLDPDGKIIGKYRKHHIPLVQVAAITGLEKYYFRPGNLGYPVWPTETGVNVGNRHLLRPATSPSERARWRSTAAI